MYQRRNIPAILLHFIALRRISGLAYVTCYNVQPLVDYLDRCPGRYLKFFSYRLKCDMPHQLTFYQRPVALIEYPLVQ